MPFPDFTIHQWMLAALAAFFAGVSKAGMAGLGMISVMIMVCVIPGKASTGAVLPLLIFADMMAAAIFRQEILWTPIRRLALPVAAGITIGWQILQHMPDHTFQPFIGWMVLAMLGLQVINLWKPELTAELPHSLPFIWVVGLLTGISTMAANAAGPIATIYLLLIGLAKKEFIATMAWLFLFVNISKVPMSFQLGYIDALSLSMNVVLVPAIAMGLWIGRKCILRLPQKPFFIMIMAFAAWSAMKLIWFR